MNVTCKNCHHTFKGHFCSNCGQSAETHKLDIHFVWHDIQHGLLHFDKGILYTAKQLFTKPGHSIRDFIEGKRIHHFKPISLVLILATLYGFLYHYFHIDLTRTFSDGNVSETAIDIKGFNEWQATHFAWITLATIPLYTFGTSIAFRKQGYNFVEYFILNTFKASQRLLFHITIFPFYYYFNETPTMKTISVSVYIIDVLLIFWTNKQFFNTLSAQKTFYLTLLSQALFLACFLTILTLVVLIM